MKSGDCRLTESELSGWCGGGCFKAVFRRRDCPSLWPANMKPLSPSRQACMALTSSKETCQSILAVSTYDARYNHKPSSHVSYIRLRVTPDNDPSLLNPNRRLKSVNQLDIILACSNPALDSSHERAALHITLPALFLDVVLEPPRRTTAAAGGRTWLDVSISKSHSQCKVSVHLTTIPDSLFDPRRRYQAEQVRNGRVQRLRGQIERASYSSPL